MAAPIAENSCGIIYYVSQTVTWLIVLIGWFVIDKQNNRREQRKEIRAAIDALGEMLDVLEQDAINFHTSGFDERKGSELRLAIQRLSARVGRLSFSENVNLNTRIIDLRRAITLRNFESTNHNVQQNDSQIILTIAAAKDSLIDELEFLFKERFLRH